MHRRWYPAIAVAAVLFVASVAPLAPGGGSGPVGADKLLHGVGYAAFAIALGRGLRDRHRPMALAFVAAVAYGLLVETVQVPLPHRMFDTADAVANTVGAAVGVVVGIIAWQRVRE